VVELKTFFFNTFYHWKAAFDYFNTSSFYDFLDFFLFLVRVYLLYTSCVPELRVLRFLMIFQLLINKYLYITYLSKDYFLIN
jgi:hypothetical protein